MTAVMTDVNWLDQPASTLFDDRAQADRAIRLVQTRRRKAAAAQREQMLLEQARARAAGNAVKPLEAAPATDYTSTYEALANAVAFAKNESTPRTIRRVLESVAGGDDGVAGDLMLLERRDEGWRRVLDREMAPLMLERVDPRGQVLLDQGAFAGPADDTVTAGNRTVVPLRADIGKVLASPEEFERRLQRARNAAPDVYDKTDAARERFRTRDRQEAEAGIDHVRTLERPREIAVAQANAARVAQRLDNAMAQGSDPVSRLRLLESELASLGVASAAGASAGDSGLRLLEQQEPAATQPASGAQTDPRLLEARVYAEAILVGRNESSADGAAYVRALEQVYSDHPELLPRFTLDAPQRAPEPDPDAVPAGVHPGQRLLHKQVLKRLEAEGLNPKRDYLRMLERMLAEERNAAAER